VAAGGEPRRAVETLLEAAQRAFGAGSLSSAELLLDQAGPAAGGDDDLQARIACLRAQVLLQAGRPADAAGIAAQMVSLTDGRDVAAAAAMRMVLIRPP
jgi:predicted negative regulator of RcsB-dependent stress response